MILEVGKKYVTYEGVVHTVVYISDREIMHPVVTISDEVDSIESHTYTRDGYWYASGDNDDADFKHEESENA
jgi:hypothetical protein